MSKAFRGNTIDKQAAADWPRIQLEAAQYPRFIVEVRKYDETAEISIQQMRYLHAVIIKEFAKQMGFSDWYVKLWLKREYGRQFFMADVVEGEDRRGQIMFECQNTFCNHLFYLPHRVKGDKFLCPECHKGGIRMFSIPL